MKAQESQRYWLEQTCFRALGWEAARREDFWIASSQHLCGLDASGGIVFGLGNLLSGHWHGSRHAGCLCMRWFRCFPEVHTHSSSLSLQGCGERAASFLVLPSWLSR